MLFLWAATNSTAPVSATAQSTPELTGEVSTPINDFGLRLLRTLTDGAGKNVIVSPLSVSLALAMTYNGAAGGTRIEIGKTLGAASLTDDAYNGNNRALLHSIETADPAIKMEVANAVWTQAGFAINPDFLKLNHDFYDAPVESLDFEREPQGAVDKINAWANDKTHGKIPTILKEVEPRTRIVLTDAVYFKGRWTFPFDSKETEPRIFHLYGGASVTTPMMAQTGEYYYFENNLYQAIRLPYGNIRFAMYVFLPREAGGLPDFLRTLDQPHWSEWSRKLFSAKGRIVLPKFELTYSQRLDDALQSMGMAIAFSTNADFSRIHQPPPPLEITEVEHKTFVKVDEEGTEAAATTAVVGGLMMAMRPTPTPFEMVVDHPFFCAIADTQSGALLFAGVVTDPSQH